MIIFGFILNDNKNLKLEIKNKELVIVQLEGKIVDQETKMLILEQDNEAKTQAIASLEEKARTSSLAAQEAVDRMIELAKIERMSPAEGPCRMDESGKNRGREENERKLDEILNEPEDSIDSSPSKTAAGRKNDNNHEVINDSSSKKFINLRNDIYSRYK